MGIEKANMRKQALRKRLLFSKKEKSLLYGRKRDDFM
jgi:hypothetical protein